MAKFVKRTPEEIKEYRRLPQEEKDRQLERILRAIKEDLELREQFMELILPRLSKAVIKQLTEGEG
jgi:hypothetical protein